jgi:hypothetical protein
MRGLGGPFARYDSNSFFEGMVESLLRPLSTKLVLSDLDLMFDFVTTIFSLLLSIEVVVYGGMAF